MLKTFQIDYIRQAFVSTLAKYGSQIDLFNDNDISIMSFYEHLESEDEVNRYVETYKELIAEQNRQHKIGVGILAISDTPELTNLRTAFVSPFSWESTIRVTLENRDKLYYTITKLTDDLKGKKIDIAELKNGKLVCVGTVGDEIDIVANVPTLKAFDYIGLVDDSEDSFSVAVGNKIAEFCGTGSLGFAFKVQNNDHLYCSLMVNGEEHLVDLIATQVVGDTFVYTLGEDLGTFKKMKLDLSFNDIKMNEPFTLNSEEYCELTFSGQATLTENKILLSNDIVKLSIKRHSLAVSTGTINFTDGETWCEPMDNASNLGSNQITSQLRSSFFLPKTNTDSIESTRNYTFLVDLSNELIVSLYEYARYCIRGTSTSSITISPNMIFEVKELVSSWGRVKIYSNKMKLVDAIPVETAENDTMSVQITLSTQGD